jgi:hypothetical protein
MTLTAAERRFVWLSVIFAIIVAVVLAENFLKFKEKYQRNKVIDYADIKRPHGLRWGGFLQENLTVYVTDGLGGKVRWTNNAAGFRSDREFTQEPLPGVLRLLSLGDSFTAGYRVDQHETFSYFQEQWINREYGEAEVMVPEISDPANALYYLDRFGLRLKPHIVLLGITLGNDIAQAYQGLDPHGGFILTMEAGKVHIDVNHTASFNNKQLEVYKIPPAYLISENPTDRLVMEVSRWIKKRHLLRRFYQDYTPIVTGGDRQHLSLFDLANGFGMFTNPPPPEIDEAYRRLFRILEGFSLICRQHHMIFAVQLFPQRYQVQPGDWDRAVAEYGLKRSRFDLMAPNRRIGAFCREHGIRCLDPTAAMARRYAQTRQNMYYPRGDMHWNRAGHRAFFECSRPAFAQLVRAGLELVQAGNPKTPPKPSPVGALDPEANRTSSGPRFNNRPANLRPLAPVAAAPGKARRICSTHCRRQVGLRSFPLPPPGGSVCPG